MNRLNKQVDNSPLILFRIIFGLLILSESIGAIVTGWIDSTFVKPEFTFNFMGFDFLQFLVGPQMYVVFGILALLGILITIGWHYRFIMFLTAILWGAVYLLQKSHYNNHYYLLWLIMIIMIFVPAHKYRSMDVRQRRVEESLTCNYSFIFIFQLQIAIVYFYAAIAKLYPDWLAAKPIGLWFSYKDYSSTLWSAEFASGLKTFFANSNVHYFVSYTGIFFDLLIIPAFIFKRTRTIALIASLVFHLFNSAMFQIGVFPYFALSFVIFFYKRDTIKRLFFKNRDYVVESLARPFTNKLLPSIMVIYFAIQIVLPLRHWVIPGNVLWTEEGHRLSWRMMLRSKSAVVKVTAEYGEDNKQERVILAKYLSRSQIKDLGSKPDMMWQFARILEKDYRKNKGIDEIKVFIEAKVGVNGRKRSQFIDSEFDLTSVKWKTFGHQDWILDDPFSESQ